MNNITKCHYFTYISYDQMPLVSLMDPIKKCHYYTDRSCNQIPLLYHYFNNDSIISTDGSS